MGEKFAYILIEADDPDGLFAGAYTPLGLSLGSFKLTPNGTYSRSFDQGTEALSLDDPAIKNTFTEDELQTYFAT